jgi:tetratricopeptide (TPR) repeat protein
MKFIEAPRLLNRVGWYLRERGRYAFSEPFCQQGQEIYKEILEPDDSEISFCHNNLSALYREQGKYEQAEPFFQCALTI